MNITYTKCGDYLLPHLTLAKKENKQLNKYEFFISSSFEIKFKYFKILKVKNIIKIIKQKNNKLSNFSKQNIIFIDANIIPPIQVFASSLFLPLPYKNIYEILILIISFIY